MFNWLRMPLSGVLTRPRPVEVSNGQAKDWRSAQNMHASVSLLPEIATPTRSAAQDYVDLKRLVKQKGLFDKQPLYYTFKILSLAVMMVAGIAFLLLVHSFWLQLLNAVYLAFVYTQFGLLGHDAGHRQIFNKTWHNDVVGLIAGNLCLGLSTAWWVNKHNMHHSHPNENDLDPDINIPIIAFSVDDIAGRSKFLRFMIRHQAIVFFPVLFLVALDLQKSSIEFLLKEKSKYRALEIVLMLLHYAACFALIFGALNFWQGIVFILVNQAFAGLYLGSIFAPNHKGMPILEKNSQLDFMRRQVLTARNVYGNPVNDMVYGGLNYQIEHHLFPAMPRNRLKDAQPLVKAFCQEHAISYSETGVVQSYCEIVGHLHRVSVEYRAMQKVK